MYLSNIKLWNFRKYGSGDFHPDKPNLDLDFKEGLNVLIGENDSGKSAIIDAIKLVLKTHSFEWIRVVEEDFYNDANQIRIELVFRDLKDNEAKNFIEWLGWEENNGISKPYLKLNYDIKRNKEIHRIFHADVKAGPDPEGTALTAEAKEYLKVTFLRPLRDAEHELIAKRNSRLSQILLGYQDFRNKENHPLISYFEEFSDNTNKYFESSEIVHDTEETNQNTTPTDDAIIESPNEEEIQENVNSNPTQNSDTTNVKKEIDKYFDSFCINANKTEIKTADKNLKSILESLNLGIQETINPGLGTLNRLFMACELLHLNKQNWDGLRLGLIEELEAHLHPQAQMQVIESLQAQENIQLILTTHSPNLASKVKIENLILCINDKAFPMGKDYTELNPDDYIHLERFLDVTKSNLFFARGIIMVEGWSEELLVPAIADKMGCSLTKNGVSVINVASKAFRSWTNIFKRKNENEKIPIPVAIITDLDKDVVPDDTANINSEKEIKKGEVDNEIDSIASEFNGGKVETFIGNERTLEICLAKSEILHNMFKEAFDSIHPRKHANITDFSKRVKKCMKEKNVSKVKIASNLAQQIVDDDTIDFTDITENDTIYYIVKAIKYATKN